MDAAHVIIPEDDPCPGIDFNYAENIFSITGMCYPENTRTFFDPVLKPFLAHLAAQDGTQITFKMSVSYFNSSASRVLAEIFDALEACAKAGNTVLVLWCYEEDDDNMKELAEDFEEDFEAATFETREVPID
ncbi:MAG: DUF1987 domain-containing protein [Rhodospirillaceae bacterium]